MRDWPIEITRRFPRAVFLDRDGTLTHDGGYDPDRLELGEGVAEGLALLSTLPVMLVVVSNQAKIGLGQISFATMMRYNFTLREQIERAGGRLDAFYFCPHPRDPDTGAPVCRCAKPQPTMLHDAEDDFGLDLARSYLVGDGAADIAAGNAADVTTIALRLAKPNDAAYTCQTFLDAAQLIRLLFDS